MANDFTFKVWQDGIMVASATASDRAAALREVMHYAMMYSQDGPVLVKGPGLNTTIEGRSTGEQNKWR